MNKWKAMAEVVRSFNEARRPGYALAAIGIIVAGFVVPTVMAIIFTAR